MKSLAIKTKIVLWYTLLMIGLMGLVLVFLFSAASKTAAFNAKSTLMTVTQDMAHEIEIDEDKIEIDHDFKTYEKGNVVLAIYKDDIVAGQYPTNFPQNTPQKPGEAFSVTVGRERWLVYDVMKDGGICVRGIHPLSEGNATWKQTLLIALIAFPLFIIIAALGGYSITKSAFVPVAKIAKTAGEIGTGNDLSKRIGAQDTNDEIARLSSSFDAMLDRLESAFNSEKQFTSDVSHELRTPLAVLKSQCEYALEQAKDEEVRAALGEMQTKIDRMIVLISRLLELSRAEHRTTELSFETVDLSELLNMVAEELQEKAAQKSIKMVIESGEKITATCEQTLIMRLMLNLIENAIKYTNNGGRVQARLETSQNTVKFCVQDSGIGIKNDDLGKIFNRFYRVNTARTAESDASFGLGLSFCKWIAEAHGGKITVESTIEEGSTFTATLPLRANGKQNCKNKAK